MPDFVLDGYRVAGELDLSTLSQLQQHLYELAGPHHVTLDFSHVTFLDCTTLTALVLAQQRANEQGGSFSIAGLHPTQRKMFVITGLTELLSDSFPERVHPCVIRSEQRTKHTFDLRNC